MKNMKIKGIYAILLLLPLAAFLAVSYGFYGSIEHVSGYNGSVPPDFKVAFIADQGLGRDSRAVLQLIKDENAEMVLHLGDFDYEDDPEKWEQQINSVLGTDFPYFAVIGNHEVEVWPAYQRKLQDRLDRIEGVECKGDLGVSSVCTYKGLFFILSGVGTKGYGYPKDLPEIIPWHLRYGITSLPSQFIHSIYIKNQLAASNGYIWKICAWHKNQRLMQVGTNLDETGWKPYEECRKGGAIIATGHHRSYSRTHLMGKFKDPIVASTSNTLEIEKGRTFAFVSGIAGKGIKSQVDELASSPWWASVYTATQDASYGALFCIFNVNGTKNKAHCYFKDIDGNIPDEFDIVSEVR